MPSSPLSVRPVLAALLTALVLASSVLVSGPATLLPAARAEAPSAAPGAPAAPPEEAEDAPVSMDLVSLTPTSLAPGGTLEAQVDVTNTSSEPLSTLELELRTRTARVTDRGVLSQWQSDTSPEPEGAALASSEPHEELAPGESTTLTVQIDAEELDYSEEPYYWGTRRLALTVASEDEALSTLRTFVVWRPDGVEEAITQSVLLPFSAGDASSMVTDPEAFAESAESGRLASLRELAQRPDVDWWLDPALLDPPMMPVPLEGGEDAPGTVREYAPEPHSAELATVLQDEVGERTVLAMPYARADTVSLEAAGADTLRGVVRDHGQQAWNDAGLAPRASAQRLDGASTDADALESVLAADGTAAVLPSSSLRADPSSSVTPSSVGVYPSSRTEGAQLTLLAPDPVLSSEFALLTADSDTEQTRQRLLAETATIASEYATAPRHLLISPSAESVLDPEATGAVLDAMDEAPWIRSGSTSTLLDAADHQSWTSDPRGGDGELYALGQIDAAGVRPSGPTSDGSWAHLDGAEDPQLLDPEALTELESSWTDIDTLATAMEESTSLEAPRREIIGATSQHWRGEPEIPEARAEHSTETAAALRDRIQVVPASGYNVISDEVSVPITISNDLDTPITARIAVTSDKPLVQVGEPVVVEVPARGQVDASVPVEAIANGTVTLTTVVSTEDGERLTEPVEVPLTVNPSWENWTTLVLVIAMGLLVIVGVARARHVGASSRAPAVRAPEDPEVLVRTGRSTVDTRLSQDVWDRRARTGGTGADGTGKGTDPVPHDPPAGIDPDSDPAPETDPAPTADPHEEDRT